MVIDRPAYLSQLKKKRNNGYIKIITGIRRCGKSFLLFELYHHYLNSIGISDDCIIELKLDQAANARYRNPLELDHYLKERLRDTNKQYYVFLDEIQMVKEIPNQYLEHETIGFVDVLLGLKEIPNADIYVTGSNSKMLSSDIVTQFRDRGDVVQLFPLSFKEFLTAYHGEREHAWRDYYTYGGLPRILELETHKEKADYLTGLFEKTYITDIMERNGIRNDKTVLDILLNIVSSSIGSLTSYTKLAKTFLSVGKVKISVSTISNYLDFFRDAFVLNKADRYDIKGKRYMESPSKWYYTDLGLRNARLNFRQLEQTHIMENILYNELLVRGFSVDVGLVEVREKDAQTDKVVRSQLEVDFVANSGNVTSYIQSAFSIEGEGKKEKEIHSFLKINDSFKKVVIVRDNITPWYDDNGILFIGLEEFLLSDQLY